MKWGLRGNKGVSLQYALVLVLIVIPIFVMIVRMTRQASIAGISGVEQREGLNAANSAIMDIMRQASNSFYDGHYEGLTRPDITMGRQTISFDVTGSSTNRTVLIRSTGRFGKSSRQQRLSALLKFQSDLIRFGLMVPSTETGIASSSNVTYDGPVVFSGSPELNANIMFNEGPVIITGTVTIPAGKTVTVDGDLYLGGGKTGSGALVQTSGSRYNFAPKISRPTLNFGYYASNFLWKTTSDIYLRFGADGNPTYSSCTTNCIDPTTGLAKPVGGWYPAKTIPAEGGIFFAENCNLIITSSTIRRPITVVASGNPGDSDEGNVDFISNVNYPNGVHAASANGSFAVLVTNKITLKVPSGHVGDYLFHGIVYQEKGDRVSGPTTGSTNLRFWGSRGVLVTGFGGTKTYAFDRQLKKFPPPGLPERPYLLTWDLRD